MRTSGLLRALRVVSHSLNANVYEVITSNPKYWHAKAWRAAPQSRLATSALPEIKYDRTTSLDARRREPSSDKKHVTEYTWSSLDDSREFQSFIEIIQCGNAAEGVLARNIALTGSTNRLLDNRFHIRYNTRRCKILRLTPFICKALPLRPSFRHPHIPDFHPLQHICRIDCSQIQVCLSQSIFFSPPL